MVRRRRMPRGLFHNQLQLPLQSLMTSASPSQLQSASPLPSAGGPQYASWLQASAPHVASNYQLLQWQQQQQQSQSLMSRLCNKMVGGCMPRLPTLPQPEVSSRKLSRLRRSPMTWQPEVIHLPHVPQVPQSVTLPHWCRATGQRQRGNVARSVESRQPDENQLKRQQQLQLWHRQQWQLQQQQQQQHQHQQQQHQQQQQQRWQQPTTVQTATRKPNNNFQPFNFGICAENFFNFQKSESSLYAATNVACAKLPVSILKNSNKTLLQGEDFSYVKVAKQMMQPATDSNNEQKNRLPVSLDKKLLSPSNEASTTTLTNTSNETLTDCCYTAKESNQKMSAESFQTSNQINVRCSEESLNQLATDIESNLSAIRQLLELQLPQNGAKQINVQELDHLATLLQKRIGVNFMPGVHLKGGETQDPKMELSLESVGTRNSSFQLKEQLESAESVISSPESVESVGTMQGSCSELAGNVRSSYERKVHMESCSHDRQVQTESIKADKNSVERKTQHDRQVQTESVEPDKNSIEQKVQNETVKSSTISFKHAQTESAGTSRCSLEQVVTQKNLQERQPQRETAKSSHDRQLNLNKLFQQRNLSGDGNPMWETLMQLAAHMCENKDESREKPPKQYSIYLMVSSDDENDEETEARDAQQIRQLSAQMNSGKNVYSASCNAGSFTYKTPENFAEASFPEMWQKKKKKRISSRKRRDSDQSLLPPRKPLHWPKTDFSRAATKKTKKMLCSSCKWNWLPNPQPLRKYQNRWA